jgi:hypothetical protein
MATRTLGRVLQIGDTVLHTLACRRCGRDLTLALQVSAAGVVPSQDGPVWGVCMMCRSAGPLRERSAEPNEAVPQPAPPEGGE